MDQEKLILTTLSKEELQKFIKQTIVETIEENKPKEKESDEELLTRKEVARLFKTSLVTLRQWEVDGIIPKPIRKGTRVLFRKSDIMNDISRKEEI